ncbi:MAG: hypothetical protein KAI20_03470 [Thermoplasmatales archaeon]|nr:hypothetical protein [Thermoplasmatales archaeon]
MKSIVEVIGRRSSEDYALVMLGNTIKKLKEIHYFLRFLQIKNTRYSEIKNVVTIDSSINEIDSEDLGKAMQEIIGMVVTAMGKDAGFFFVKEIKNKIGPNYEIALRNMGVDLDFMQFSFEVDKKQTRTLTIENSDVFRLVLKTLIALIEKEIGRDFAISTVTKLIEEYANKYDFLKNITMVDIRYTLGENEINVGQEIDRLEPTHVGKAIEDIIVGVHRSLGENGKPLHIDEFKRQLTSDYRTKLEEMGVNLKKKQFGNSLVFKYVIKALIAVISQASTQRYAVFAMNSFLKKIDTKYVFLKHIVVNPVESDELCDVSLMTNLDEISETDIRRSIQKLLEEIIDSLGAELGQKFINKFKDSLEKNCLLQIEEMGVNLHMIQLRQELLRKT